MSMGIELLPDTQALTLINDTAGTAPEFMRVLWTRTATRLGRATVQKLAAQPGKPKYPIRWKTERQRRAFFATNGFGRGIPTQRTDALSSAWQSRLVDIPDGQEAQVFNDTSYAGFVQGKDQQPFHLDTGWAVAGLVVAQERAIYTEALKRDWFTVTDPFRG